MLLRRIVAALCALALAAGPAAAQYRPGQAPGFRPGPQFIGGLPTFDFASGIYPPVTVSRASPGYAADASGNYTPFANDTLRRTNVGATIEGAQTNSIRNGSAQGATTSASSISLPTNWAGGIAFSGSTASTPFVGSDAGLDVIEYTLSGTTPAVQATVIQTETPTGSPASAGQLLTGSFFYRITSGDAANAALQIALREYDSGGTFLRQTLTPLSNTAVSAKFSRATVSATLGASTAFATTGLRCAAASGVALNFGIRFGSVMQERRDNYVVPVAGASTPIRTTGTAAARATDAVSFTVPAGASKILFTFDDGSQQQVSASPGLYTIPPNLNRPVIRRLQVQP
jgi:hypothetical protein